MKNKVFITGIFGSGKTYFAKKFVKHNKEYSFASYDENYDYATKDDSAVTEVASSQDHDVVMDALPIPYWSPKNMSKFCEENKVSIVLVKCTNKEEWAGRLKGKSWWNEKDAKENYNKWSNEFYTNFVNTYRNLKDICEFKFLDSSKNKYCDSIEELYEDKKFKELLDSQPHDKYYQDIEFIGLEGYSKSHESWANISELKINWPEATVCELGCFHSYFGIKISKEGAKKVYGLDSCGGAIEMSKEISKRSGVEIEYLHWIGGEKTPKCDIATIMNMLHHCEDQHKTLENTNCTYALFEINEDQRATVEKHFITLKETESTRPGRVILFGEKINEN